MIALWPGHFNPLRRHVSEIVFLRHRQLDVGQRKAVVILLRHIPRQVRFHITDGEEQWLVRGRGLEMMDGPVGQLVVAQVSGLGIDRTPVEVTTLEAIQIFLVFLNRRKQPGPLRPRVLTTLGVEVVVDLTAAASVVAVGEKVAVDGAHILEHALSRITIRVNARLPGPQTAHQGRTRRVAGGRGAVRVRERGAACHEAVDVRCFRLRMAAEVAGPVVQIIDRDEQHIRLRLSDGKAAQEEEKSEKSSHGPP